MRFTEISTNGGQSRHFTVKNKAYYRGDGGSPVFSPARAGRARRYLACGARGMIPPMRPAVAAPGRQRLALLGILVLAAGLRLYRLDLMEFKADEANALRRVAAVIEGGEVPSRGLTSSVGVPNPPVLVYLLLLPGMLSLDPEWIAAFVAGLGVVTVGLAWRFGSRIFNVRVAWIAAVLFATAPAAVLLSRKIWAQDCMALFSVVALGGLWETCVAGNRRWFVPAALAAGLLPGLHFSGVWLSLLFVLALVVRRPRLRRGAVFGVGLVLAAVYVPWGLSLPGEASIHFSFSPRAISAEPLVSAARLVGTGDLRGALGTSAPAFAASLFPGLRIVGSVLYWILAGLAGLGALELLVRPAKRGLLALWVLVPVVGFIGLQACTPFHPHYVAGLLPVPFWLAAHAIDRFARRGRACEAVAVGLVVATALAGVALLVGLFGFLEDEGGARGDYGVTYEVKRYAAAFVAAADGSVSPEGLVSVPYAYLAARARASGSDPGRERRPASGPTFAVREWNAPATAVARFGPVSLVRRGSSPR
jgi:4-amino-4-deoxy-L-arabinose transferase-like glycosyltransferase